MKDIELKKILDSFRGSNSIEIKTKTDKPPNVESPFDFNASQLESIALKYYELVTLEELSELEAKHLEKILEQAETDERLSLLLNEIDEITFQELGFYNQDNLEQIEQQKAKVKEAIINSEKTQIVDCINKLQSISGYQNILNEYYRLVTLEELSELEAKQLDKILEQAENDQTLSLLLNEVDELTFQELDFYEKDSLEQIEKQKGQKENAKQYIERICCLTNSNDNLSSSKIKQICKYEGFIHNTLAIAASYLIAIASFLLLCNLSPNIGYLSTLINQNSTKSTPREKKQSNSPELKKVDNSISQNSESGGNISISASNLSFRDWGVISINSNKQNDDDIKPIPEEQGNIIINISSLSLANGNFEKGDSGKVIINPELNSGNISIVATELINISGANNSTGELHYVKFICDLWQGTPTTIIQTSQKEFPLIHWKSDYFSMSGYSTEARCEIVSQRFNELYRMGNLNYLTTARINGYSVICAAREIGGDCFEQLFTVNPDIDPNQLLDDISKKLIRVPKENHKDRPKFTEEIAASNNIVGVIGHFRSSATNIVVKYLDMNQYLSRVIALEQNTDIAIFL